MPRKRKPGTIAIGIIAVVVFVALAFILAAPLLDQVDKQWVSCEASSAKPVLSGGKSAKWAVEISSSCGQIWFDRGVTSNNAAAIARKFIPHTEYEFQFGWLSQVYQRSGVSTPNAQAWR